MNSASRYSIPIFHAPRSEMDLDLLRKLRIQWNLQKNSKNITAGEFLEERLRELGI